MGSSKFLAVERALFHDRAATFVIAHRKVDILSEIYRFSMVGDGQRNDTEFTW